MKKGTIIKILRSDFINFIKEHSKTGTKNLIIDPSGIYKYEFFENITPTIFNSINNQFLLNSFLEKIYTYCINKFPKINETPIHYVVYIIDLNIFDTVKIIQKYMKEIKELNMSIVIVTEKENV